MKTIVIIDDEPELLELLEYIFKQLSYGVITFHQAISVQKVKNLCPDLILVDYNLGSKTGGEMCQELKAYPPTKNIPVIMCSGEDQLPKLAKENSADAFLKKPFDIATLHKTVKGFA